MVGGGLAGMSAANTVVENGGRTPGGRAMVDNLLSPYGSMVPVVFSDSGTIVSSII